MGCDAIIYQMGAIRAFASRRIGFRVVFIAIQNPNVLILIYKHKIIRLLDV